MRLPFGPLAQIAVARWRPNDEAAVAWVTENGKVDAVLGLSTGTAARWRVEGLTERAADRAAIALGLHPALVWGDMWWQSVSDAA